MAKETERERGGDSRIWWQQAYDVLSGMQRRKMFISPQDSRILIQIRNKLGF